MQHFKWGEQNHDLPTWMCILHEETGELSEAILHEKFGGPEAGNVFKEAVQVAAVACQIVEYLLRKRNEGFLANVQCDATALLGGVDGWLGGRWKVGIHDLFCCRLMHLLGVGEQCNE